MSPSHEQHIIHVWEERSSSFLTDPFPLLHNQFSFIARVHLIQCFTQDCNSPVFFNGFSAFSTKQMRNMTNKRRSFRSIIQKIY